MLKLQILFLVFYFSLFLLVVISLRYFRIVDYQFLYAVANHLNEAVLFFWIGRKIKGSDLLNSLKNSKFHVISLFFQFVASPIVFRIFIKVVGDVVSLDPRIAFGLVTVSCNPPSPILTIVAGRFGCADQALAVTNSILGASLGITLAPLLLFIHVGQSVATPIVEPLLLVTCVNILPLAVGQAILKFRSPRFEIFGSYVLRLATTLALLFSICDVIGEKEVVVGAADVLTTVSMIIPLVAFPMAGSAIFAFWENRKTRREVLSTQDIVTLMICSSNKSVSYGIPVLKILYGGYSHLSQYILPLLIYGPAQLFHCFDRQLYGKNFLGKSTRRDSRNFDEGRPVSVNISSIKRADGSAIVRIGRTSVVCGVKVELAKPKPETPKEGYVVVNFDVPPLSSPSCQPGPPSDEAQLLTCLVERALTSSKALDLTSLCIVPDKLVWALYVDLICLNHDGGLLDAGMLAATSAMKDVKLPDVTVQEGGLSKTVSEHSSTPLPLIASPFAATFSVFDEGLLLDPSSEEEALCSGMVSLIVSPEPGQPAPLYTPGCRPLLPEELKACTQVAKTRANYFSELIKVASTNILPDR